MKIKACKKRSILAVAILVVAVLAVAILLITINHREPIDVERSPYAVSPYANPKDSIVTWVKDFNNQDIEMAVNHINYLKEHAYSNEDVFTMQDRTDRVYRWLLAIDEKMLTSGAYESVEVKMSLLRATVDRSEYWVPFRISLTGATSKDGTKIYLR